MDRNQGERKKEEEETGPADAPRSGAEGPPPCPRLRRRFSASHLTPGEQKHRCSVSRNSDPSFPGRRRERETYSKPGVNPHSTARDSEEGRKQATWKANGDWV